MTGLVTARSALAVLAGYAVVLVASALVFTGAYFALGPDRAFRAGTFEITPVMAICGLIAAMLAGVAGRLASRAISDAPVVRRMLLGFTFVITLASGVPMLLRDGPLPRNAGIGRIDAMKQAFHPRWFTLLFPVAQFAGILIATKFLALAASPSHATRA